METHMEVVPLPLELSGGVHLVRHDARNSLMDYFNLADNTYYQFVFME